jgi:hypothetical protein
VVNFGANAPRPVLHQMNAAQGDPSRAPAFPKSGGRRRWSAGTLAGTAVSLRKHTNPVRVESAQGYSATVDR